jgi:hypothetical protein
MRLMDVMVIHSRQEPVMASSVDTPDWVHDIVESMP